jgi:rRNA-processing protein FCF1
MNLVELLKGKYKQKGVFVDTNMLVLYIMGTTDIKHVNRTISGGNTANYTENDFILASAFIDYFDRKISSPHILTETSNLLGENYDFHSYLKNNYIDKVDEIYERSKNLAENNYYSKLGLADSSIISASTKSKKDSHLVFTVDGPLSGYLKNIGIDFVTLQILKNNL